MEIIDLTLLVLLFLFAAALLAGFIDSLVGGGGFITIPALLIAGLPPHFALGTNKLQAVVGSGSAMLVMIQRRKVRWRQVRWLMLSAFIGSAIGTVLLQFVNAEVLILLIPLVLLLVAVYFLFAPTAVASKTKIGHAQYASSAVPIIGVYDGFLGPGTGSFFTMAGSALRGMDIITASANARALNFATNIASLLVFAFFIQISWQAGIVMMLGQFVGANLGARYLLVIKPNRLKYALVLASITMLVVWFFAK